MEKQESKHWLMRCRKKKRLYRLVVKAIYGIGIALLGSLLLGWVYAMPCWVTLVCALFIGALYACISGFEKPSLLETAFYLDAKFPELEYSSSLFLKPTSSLATLQRIQLEKVEERVAELSHRPDDHYHVLKKPLLFLILCTLLYTVGHYFQKGSSLTSAETDERFERKPKQEIPMPAVFTNAELQIRFPAYTRLPVREQHDLSISALKGAIIRLRLHTNTPMKEVALLFNGQKKESMKRVAPLVWESVFPVKESGFYQIQYDGNTSNMYPLEAIPDQPVSITVLHPDPHQNIEPGYAPVVALEAHLSDDFAIKDAAIMATTSSGKGESVQFKSREIALHASGGEELKVKQSLDMKALEMKPGDELFFYLRAHDLAGQESRSDIYVVSWQDTTELMSLSGIVSGSDVKPEYFRSQRQIILDIEKLMTESPKLSKEEGQRQSNNIGIDQKLLRLRYGQFLGEEAEEDNGGDHDHDHRHNPEEGEEEHRESVPEDIVVLQDQLTHHHDRAEDATFFTPDQKAQLKATLTEMWNAELKLRTYQPQQALPYAYKALKLLKDLQQQSRTYVAKVSSKPNPLKPEKRLSGDLADIVEPRVQIERPAKDQRALMITHLRKTLAYFSNLNEDGTLDKAALLLLTGIQEELIRAATSAPGKYLRALKVAREMEESAGVYTKSQVRVLSTAIQELLPQQYDQPAAKRKTPDESIYHHYLNLISRP